MSVCSQAIRRRKALLARAALLAAVLACAVMAVLPAAATEYAVTLSGSASALSIPDPRQFLAIDNEAASGGNAIACAFYGATPALNTAGSWTIQPGATRTWRGSAFTPQGPVKCIAAGSSTPVTVEAF